MGATQCCSGNESEKVNNYQYDFGQDKNEPQVNHTDSIETIDEACKFFLLDCEQRLKHTSRLYKDPTVSSEPLLLKQASEGKEIKCAFHRPYHFLKEGRGKKYRVFHDQERNCNDIRLRHDALQYFSMLLCFLADKPHLIKNIILTQANTYGICAVAMYFEGLRRHVFIDDYILCYQDKPIFSQPIDGGFMWPCLIEKAWLKVRGYASHQILISSPLEAFHHFLQYPYASYNLVKMEAGVYQKLKEGLLERSDNGIMATSRQEPHHKIGLSGRRSYYFKCVIEFQGKTLYYLRNPCGAFDFRGCHSIISPQLQEMLKKEAREGVIAQGNFVLEEGEFLEQMEELEVVYYNRDSTVISDQLLRLKGGEEIFIRIELSYEEQMSLCFVQEGESFCPVTYQAINEKDGRMISGLANEDGCFGIRSTSLLVDTFQRLQPGDYLIRLKKKPIKLQQITLEANDKIVITASRRIEINYVMQELYHNKFFQFLMDYCTQQMGVVGASHHRGMEIEHASFWLGDLVVICISKVDKVKRLNLEVSFTDRVNLECISHSLNGQFTALPLHDQHLLIVFEKIDLTGETVLGKYSIEAF